MTNPAMMKAIIQKYDGTNARISKDDYRVLCMKIYDLLQRMDETNDEVRHLLVQGYNEYPGEFDDVAVEYAKMEGSLAFCMMKFRDRII